MTYGEDKVQIADDIMEFINQVQTWFCAVVGVDPDDCGQRRNPDTGARVVYYLKICTAIEPRLSLTMRKRQMHSDPWPSGCVGHMRSVLYLTWFCRRIMADDEIFPEEGCIRRRRSLPDCKSVLP